MHEFSLYGQVAKEDHDRLLCQLAGICRMQPQPSKEIHLVFRAQSPAGLGQVAAVGGSQTVTQQDAQKVRALLNGSLYYMQVVGVLDEQVTSLRDGKASSNSEDVVMLNGKNANSHISPSISWNLEFRDIPDPGKQPTSNRLTFRTPLRDGDVMRFMHGLGYEYVSRYFITGNKFYDQDTTLSLQKVVRLPQETDDKAAIDTSFLHKIDLLNDLDPGGNYNLQASVEVLDGNNPDLKDKAVNQLLSLKEVLKRSVLMVTGDRLALDTRLPAAARRI